jgi:hypothetical protein
MTGAGSHPIDPAYEAADTAATRHLSNELEELRIVTQKEQEAQSYIFSRSELDPDIFMNTDVEAGVLDLFLDEPEELRVDESGQSNAVLSVELRAKAIQMTHRRRGDRARSGELDHNG